MSSEKEVPTFSTENEALSFLHAIADQMARKSQEIAEDDLEGSVVYNMTYSEIMDTHSVIEMPSGRYALRLDR